jgi:hypothetical protein
VTNQGGNFQEALAKWGTQDYFEGKIRDVDPWAEVDFEPMGYPYSIRIRPSHPQYRHAVIRVALAHRALGTAVSVLKEVDDWIRDDIPTLPYLLPKLPVWRKVLRAIRGI